MPISNLESSVKKISKLEYIDKFNARTIMLKKKAGIKENRLSKSRHADVFVAQSGKARAAGAFLVRSRKKE